jgi:hypothetical protein
MLLTSPPRPRARAESLGQGQSDQAGHLSTPDVALTPETRLLRFSHAAREHLFDRRAVFASQ